MGNPRKSLSAKPLFWGLGLLLLASAACSPLRHSPKPVVPVTLFACSDIAVLPFAWNAPEDTVYRDYEKEMGREVSSRAESTGVFLADETVALFQQKGVTATAISPDISASLQAQVDALSEQGYTCVLLGRVERYEARIGSDWSVNRPASVALKVLLMETATRRVLWKGVFDEAQQPLSENLLTLKRFVLRKARWVTADALAQSGVLQLVDAMVRQGTPPPLQGGPKGEH